MESDAVGPLGKYFLSNERRSILPFVGLIDLCKKHYAIPASHLLVNTGISEPDLLNPHNYISLDQTIALRINAVKFLCPEKLGQLWGEACNPEYLWAFGVLIKTADSIEDAIKIWIKLGKHLEYLPFRFIYERSVDSASIRVPFKFHTSVQGLIVAENAIMSKWLGLLKNLGLPNDKVLSLHYTLSEPNDLSHYEYFAPNLQNFGQDFLEIKMPLDAVDRKSVYADPKLHRVTKEYLDSYLKNQETLLKKSGLFCRIQRYIADRVFHQHYQVNDLCVARLTSELEISPSTLHRLLKKEGVTSFKRYIYEGKLEAAEKILLTTNSSIEEISERLGYRNAANFVRAFKKAKGLPPKAYSQQLLEKQAC